MNRKLLAVIVLLAAVFLVQVGVVRADLYGSIRGTVTDQSGAALAGATLTATNMATNISQRVTSGADGAYNFLQLPIGDYSVKVEKSGFETFTAARIHLDVNTVYIQDVKLQIGAITQEITVQANQVQVETATPQLGAVVSSDMLENLPLLGRDWIQLQQLQPGVVGASDRFGATGTEDVYASNGAQSQMNAYMIDGTETNDIALNTPTFIPSPDSIAEFRMVTSTINPEYARSSGSILNATFKSGTNSFHGDAFEFFRSTGFDAINYFAPPPRAPNPFHQNLFGGTIGGPVIKNHTFFFFSYQGVRETGPQTNPLGPTISTPVYNASELAGDFSEFDFNGSPGSPVGAPMPYPPTFPNRSPFALFGDSASPCPVSGGTMCPAGTYYGDVFAPDGSIITHGLFSTGMIPTQDFGALSSALLKKYVPAANTDAETSAACTPSTSDPTCSVYTFDASTTIPNNQYIARIDQTFNSKDSLWGTYVRETESVSSTIPFVGATVPGFGESDSEAFRFVTVSWTHIFNDHVLNELRGGYNRFNFEAVFPTTPTLPSSAGFDIAPQVPSGAGLPVVNVVGLFSIGFSSDGPQPRIDEVYEAVDNLQVVHGQHVLKFGFDMRRWQVHNPFSFSNDGTYYFGSYGTYSTGVPGADFLLGIPANYDQSSGGNVEGFARQYYSYVQDQYKLRPNLTLSYGMGWTIDTPMLNTAFGGHGQLAFVPNQQSIIFPNAPLGVVFQGDPGVHAAGETKPFRNWGPRFGIAYSPNGPEWLTGGAGKTSIRAGFGIYYDRSEEEQSGQVNGMPPFSISSLFGVAAPGSPVDTINPSFANPFVDIKTGTAIANPFPFPGPSKTVTFTSTNGNLPVWGTCCAVLSQNTVDPMAENYNVTMQRQFGATTLLTIGYVGSVAHHLSVGLPVNIATGLVGLGEEGGAPYETTYAYNPTVYGPIDTIFSGGNSNYNSMQVSLNKRLSHGLQFLASYTYAHSIDDASGFENSTFGEFGLEAGGFSALRATNPYCWRTCDYASSIFDARHRFVISYIYQIPGVHGSWWLSRLTQGWTFSGITIFQTGFPLDVVDESEPSGGCLAADFSCWDGPNQVAPVTYMNPRTTGSWFNPSAFAEVSCPPAFEGGCPAGGVAPNTVAAYGNAPRNPLRGPGINNWNIVLYKDTKVSERTTMELRLESYNTFNHTQFDPNGVNTDIIATGLFGTIHAAHDPRLVQIAAKLLF